MLLECMLGNSYKVFSCGGILLNVILLGTCKYKSKSRCGRRDGDASVKFQSGVPLPLFRSHIGQSHATTRNLNFVGGNEDGGVLRHGSWGFVEEIWRRVYNRSLYISVHKSDDSNADHS